MNSGNAIEERVTKGDGKESNGDEPSGLSVSSDERKHTLDNTGNYSPLSSSTFISLDLEGSSWPNEHRN